MRLFTGLMFVLCAAPVAMADEVPSLHEVAELAVENVFRPGFTAYADATATLVEEGAALCDAPGEASLSATRDAFSAAAEAWSRVELYRIGPLMDDNRSERTFFWPDRKGIALKQVQQVLAEQDETATDAATLAGKSVAMQGLGALEYLLWGTGADALSTAEGSFRCRYAEAIAGNLDNMARAMSAEWTDENGISKRLIDPTDEDVDYRSHREVAEKLAGLLAHGVEIIRDQRLLPFLGRDGEAAKPKSAPFWRSGLTAASIRGNFAGLKTLFEDSEIAAAGGPDSAWVGNTGGFEFRNAERGGAVLTSPVEEALNDPKQRRGYDYLVIVTQSLGTILGENLSAALDLSVGFSSLDGD